MGYHSTEWFGYRTHIWPTNGAYRIGEQRILGRVCADTLADESARFSQIQSMLSQKGRSLAQSDTSAFGVQRLFLQIYDKYWPKMISID